MGSASKLMKRKSPKVEFLKKKHFFWILGALGPTVFLFALIRIYPILDVIYLSFHRYHIIRKHNPFVGLRNYQRLLRDAAFHEAFFNTLQFTILALVITLLLALLLAVLLKRIERASPVYEAIFYLPVATPWVPASVVWKWIYDPRFGVLNYFLSFLGISKQAWLSDPHLILYAIVGVAVWKMLGYFTIIYGVGLRNIPDVLMDAAEVDGATSSQRFFYVTLPLLKPIVVFTVVMGTIIFFNLFAPIYVLTSEAQGAPAYEFKVVVLEIYRNGFQFYRMGYAGAESVALLTFVVALIVMEFYVLREK